MSASYFSYHISKRDISSLWSRCWPAGMICKILKLPYKWPLLELYLSVPLPICSQIPRRRNVCDKWTMEPCGHISKSLISMDVNPRRHIPPQLYALITSQTFSAVTQRLDRVLKFLEYYHHPAFPLVCGFLQYCPLLSMLIFIAYCPTYPVIPQLTPMLSFSGS